MTTSPESKWTSGPWRVEEGTTVIWSDNAYDPGTNCVGCIVARAAQPPSWRGSRPTEDEQEANAHLIASAPEMASFVKKHADAGDVEAQALWRTINGTS